MDWRREIESRSDLSILATSSRGKQTAEEAGSYWQVIEVGGERGIRTPGSLSTSTVFKTAALNRSAISPRKTRADLPAPSLKGKVRAYVRSMRSKPPMKGRSTSGIVTDPSSFW